MSYLRAFVGLLLVSFVVLLAGLIASGIVRRQQAELPLDGTRPIGQPEATGLSFESSDPAGRRIAVTVEHVVREKVKLGPLTLNPLSDVHMSDVVLEISGLAGPDALPLELLREAIDGVALRGKTGPRAPQGVRSVSLKPLRLVFRQRDGSEVELRTARMTMGPGARMAELHNGFSIRSTTNQYLVGREAVWRWNPGRLSIRGRYAYRDTDGSHSAQGGTFAFGPLARISHRASADAADPSVSSGLFEEPRP